MGTQIETMNGEMDSVGDRKAHATGDGVIPCVTWTLEADPVLLSALPDLPELPDTGCDPESEEEETRLIQIAGFAGHLIGLTNKGHVLKYSSLDSEESAFHGRWEYVRYAAPSFPQAGSLIHFGTAASQL